LLRLAITPQKGFTFFEPCIGAWKEPAARIARGSPVVVWNAFWYSRKISDFWRCSARLWWFCGERVGVGRKMISDCMGSGYQRGPGLGIGDEDVSR